MFSGVVQTNSKPDSINFCPSAVARARCTLIVIACWVVIGHTSWIIYKKFGWIAGLLTGMIIDLPLEFLAFHLGWWAWIPSWSPALFFNTPVVNFAVYLSVSLGSILTYNYTMKTQLQQKARAENE